MGAINRNQRSSAPWRVGVLFSKTGFMSVIEETQLRGTLIAIDEINDRGGVNGRPIEPVVYDPGSEVRSYGQYAKRLMVEDGVSTIFGCYTSSSRKAVLPGRRASRWSLVVSDTLRGLRVLTECHLVRARRRTRIQCNYAGR